MILEDLEKKLAVHPRAKLIYVIPTFQNPTGRTWSLERRKGLLALAERYHLPILEDNPYGELRYEGQAIPTLRSMDTKGNVVYMGSFSKILSPGIRLGWLVASREMLAMFETAKQGSDLQASTYIQMMVDTYLEDNDLDADICKLNALYRSRRDLMLSVMEREFPKDSSWTHPDGGLFLWVTLPESMDTDAILPRAVEQKVAYIPGHSFFAGGSTTNTLRLNFSNANEDHIVEGICRLGRVLRQQL